MIQMHATVTAMMMSIGMSTMSAVIVVIRMSVSMSRRSGVDAENGGVERAAGRGRSRSSSAVVIVVVGVVVAVTGGPAWSTGHCTIQLMLLIS